MTRKALCELFGISRQTGYKWARRFAESRGSDRLEERSRRPQRSPTATPEKLVKAILRQRRNFPTWGPVPLRKMLTTSRPDVQWPSASTFGGILKRHGMVSPRLRRQRAAPGARPFSRCREPNDVWCVDFKGQFETRDGRLCYPLTVMDATTRYLLACTAFHSPSLQNVQEAFEKLFRTYGLPKALRSDNGEPFASTGAAGMTRLSAWWAKLGIRLERIEPGKPQQNGRHERMHLTLKIETCIPPRASLGRQQRAFDLFRVRYNEVRPHQALDLETPASLYQPSCRPFPDVLPTLRYPLAESFRVKTNGAIRWGARNLFVSTSLAGELVGVDRLDGRYARIMFANVVLGFVDTTHFNGGLIRPKVDRRKTRNRLSAMSPV
jgi:putative transposase